MKIASKNPFSPLRRAALIPATLVLAGGLAACGSEPAPAPETSTVTATQTTTATSTTTTTRTPSPTTRESTPTYTTEEEPAPEPQQEEQWPTPPYTAGTNKEWATMGPYGTQNPCEQAADSQTIGASSCFQRSDGWYFYFIRQAL